MSSPLIVVAGLPREEEWVPLATKYGTYVPMHPRYFPVCGSRNECLDRVRLRLGQDDVFKRKWGGWTFLAVRFDDAVVNKG